MLFKLDLLQRLFGLVPVGVLHIGGHLGEEALDYARCGISKVIWVEANPALVPRLRKVVEPHGHMVVQALVGDRERAQAPFHITSNDESSSLLTLGTHAQHYPEVKVTEIVHLPVTTIDAIASDIGVGRFDFVNLDIQGAELLALRGAATTLRDVRYVYTEVNREHVYEGCALVSDVDAFLRTHGFARVATRWTEAGWGDAFYIRGGSGLVRRCIAAVVLHPATPRVRHALRNPLPRLTYRLRLTGSVILRHTPWISRRRSR